MRFTTRTSKQLSKSWTISKTKVRLNLERYLEFSRKAIRATQAFRTGKLEQYKNLVDELFELASQEGDS